MIIKKYGIALHRLTFDDIELVRKHRNSETIRSKMFYQKNITKKEQEEWFKTINNHLNYYFTIHYKNKKVGLIHGTILSFEEKTTKGGLFIWDDEIRNTHIPILASICMADLTFIILRMKATFAEVRKDNLKALDYNKNLGYIIDNQNKEKVSMMLTADEYLCNSSTIKKKITKITKDKEDLNASNFTFSKNELKSKLYSNLPKEIVAYFKVNLD